MIAHPPCLLPPAGCTGTGAAEARSTRECAAVRADTMSAPIPKIALENPIGCISTQIRKRTRSFSRGISVMMRAGDVPVAEDLPLLHRRNPLPGMHGRGGRTGPERTEQAGPSPDRWKKRSTTYPGFHGLHDDNGECFETKPSHHRAALRKSPSTSRPSAYLAGDGRATATPVHRLI